MSTVINIHINTDDMDLVERVGAAIRDPAAPAAPAANARSEDPAVKGHIGLLTTTETAEAPRMVEKPVGRKSSKEKAQAKVKARQEAETQSADPAQVSLEAPAPGGGLGSTFTQAEISAAITDLSRKKTLPIAANIVKTTLMSAEGEPEKFAVRVGDIPASKYAEVMSRIQAALGNAS